MHHKQSRLKQMIVYRQKINVNILSIVTNSYHENRTTNSLNTKTNSIRALKVDL